MKIWNSLKQFLGTDDIPPSETSRVAVAAPAPFVLKRPAADATHLKAPRHIQPAYTSTLSAMMLQIEQAEELAKTGHAAAQKELPDLYHALGMKYYLGTGGVSKSQADAFHWFLRASAAGHWPSVFRLTIMYKNFPAGQPHLLKIRFWLMKAIEQGSEEALEFLGHLYEFGGKAQPPHPELALEWYGRFNALAMPRCTFAKKAFMTAKQYEQPNEILRLSGIPSLHSILQARNWYLHAAELGSTKAMGRLGMAYEEGTLGLAKNLDEAKKWYDMYNKSLPTYDNDPTVKILGELGLSRGTQVDNPPPLVRRDGLNG